MSKEIIKSAFKASSLFLFWLSLAPLTANKAFSRGAELRRDTQGLIQRPTHRFVAFIQGSESSNAYEFIDHYAVLGQRGARLLGDEVALESSLQAARDCRENCEAFVFHLRDRGSKGLRLEAYFFLNGERQDVDQKKLSWRSLEKGRDLDFLTAFVDEHAAQDRAVQKTSAYLYTHRDHKSLGRAFALLKHFRSSQRGAGLFDLVALSTCFGASPGMLVELSELANLAVASSTELHLSGLLPNDLITWEVGVEKRAELMLERSFKRISQMAPHLEQSLAIYDLQEIAPELRHMITLNPHYFGLAPQESRQFTNCRDHSELDLNLESTLGFGRSQEGKSLYVQKGRYSQNAEAPFNLACPH